MTLVLTLLLAAEAADAPTLSNMSREQLLVERERVAALRPSAALSTALMAAGGGTIALSIVVGVIDIVAALASSLGGSGGDGYTIVFFTAVGFAGAGALSLIAGFVKFLIDRPERELYGEQLDAIDKQLEAPAPPVAPPSVAPPPPL